ncbi:transmembrane protein, putative [Bodo saltans]|uniref:Transmembrane protein, putative n=1 Tax=Bodo saltans TaxID=75058 RepID=A0A0S4JXC1_BODSA|nr:transmembrane protein, putative [Bodo saltans]|eukprot:CUG93229.1 transmembrane protein, putative [Bodo saltans]
MYKVTTLSGTCVPFDETSMATTGEYFGPWGAAYYSPTDTLYVVDSVRRRICNVSMVGNRENCTTVATCEPSTMIVGSISTAVALYYLCVVSGQAIYVTGNGAVFAVNFGNKKLIPIPATTTNVVQPGKFTLPRGIVENSFTTSILIVADQNSNCLRAIDLLNSSTVSTITISGYDAPRGDNTLIGDDAALTASSHPFNGPIGIAWYCNRSSSAIVTTSSSSSFCGVLVADFGNNAIRFLPLYSSSLLPSSLSGTVISGATLSISRRRSSNFVSSTLSVSGDPSPTRSLGDQKEAATPSETTRNRRSFNRQTTRLRSSVSQTHGIAKHDAHDIDGTDRCFINASEAMAAAHFTYTNDTNA